ncbi:hypothetical protein AGMMS49982_22560 [Bacteroidia bacterium]|nr:hypothetical protein AGMMS49982_22560 [Bacteroidia bacterium]
MQGGGGATSLRAEAPQETKIAVTGVVSDADTIAVAYSGYSTQEVSVNGQTTINVTLAENADTLDEVVVTASGIKRNTQKITN